MDIDPPANDNKRKAEDVSDSASKRPKTKGSHNQRKTRNNEPAFKPGDAGLWVTCPKNRERKCIGELKDLLDEYMTLLYPGTAPEGAEEGSGDIEGSITAELAGIKTSTATRLFEAKWTDIQCLIFVRTASPVDPLTLVHRIIEDAVQDTTRKRTTVVQRLTPSARLAYASPEGLEEVAREALAEFWAEPIVPKKFAIRVTIRNHSVLKRDEVIKKVASMVGDAHSVELKNYDRLILVDVVKNVCAVTVVGPEYDRWKRYNLQEIFDPTPVEG